MRSIGAAGVAFGLVCALANCTVQYSAKFSVMKGPFARRDDSDEKAFSLFMPDAGYDTIKGLDVLILTF